MGVTVCSERSSCPCLCSGVDEKSVSRSVGSCNFQGSGMKNCRPVARLQILSGNKENRPAKDQRILSGISGGKMVRCGCGAAEKAMTLYFDKVVRLVINGSIRVGCCQVKAEEIR